MYLAKVVGTVVSTQKDEHLVGCKLLLTQRLDEHGARIGGVEIAIDNVGAGSGEVVIVSTGSAARQASGRSQGPFDATIVGIVDTLEVAD